MQRLLRLAVGECLSKGVLALWGEASRGINTLNFVSFSPLSIPMVTRSTKINLSGHTERWKCMKVNTEGQVKNNLDLTGGKKEEAWY